MKVNNDQELIASVIILGYNGKQYLEACISSALNQDLRPGEYEVIYADNGSSDGSADYVADMFPAVRVLRFPCNYGFAEGNNRAATFARGRYLAFLNQDMIVHHRWLSELIRVMGENRQVKACYSVGLPYQLGDPVEEVQPGAQVIYGDIGRFGAVEFREAYWGEESVPTLLVGGGAMVIEREFANQLGYLFDSNFFMYGEDIDLGLRLNGLGHQVMCVPTSLVYHARSERASLNLTNLCRLYWATRNRFLAYFKNMYILDFLRVLPLLLIGSVVKLRYAKMSRMRQILYAALAIPLSLFSLAIAALMFPRFLDKRRAILKARIRERGWIIRELRNR